MSGLIDWARTRYVPGLVLAEVDYFLRHERRAMQLFMRDVVRGAFTYAPPTPDHLARAMEVGLRYADLGSAWLMPRLWRLPSHSTSDVLRRATCATSQPSVFATGGRSSWSWIQWIRTIPESRISACYYVATKTHDGALAEMTLEWSAPR